MYMPFPKQTPNKINLFTQSILLATKPQNLTKKAMLIELL